MLLVALDLRRSSQDQVTSWLLLAGIDFYQEVLPVPGKPRCRLVPTCSHYAEEVVGRFGAWKGGGLTVRRLVRCGPWTAVGTEDPPPGRVGVGK